MGAIEHLTIALSAEQAAKVRARVAAGGYADESAVVEQALAALEVMDGEFDRIRPPLDQDEEEKWLRTEVVAAYDEMERDPSRGIPLEAVIAQLKADRLARGE